MTTNAGEELAAKVFVSGASTETLVSIVEAELDARAVLGGIDGEHIVVDVRKNEDHNTPIDLRRGPRFLYFPHYLDIEPASQDETRPTFVRAVAGLLCRLEDAGLAYVTAADIEGDLPHSGRSG